jgi:transcriptional regulator with XRE-family HTH domain
MKEQSEFAIKIGAGIRRLRLERKRSQEDFADDCGIARSYMGAIERGEKIISVVMARRVVTGLGITLSQFFAEIGE